MFLSRFKFPFSSWSQFCSVSTLSFFFFVEELMFSFWGGSRAAVLSSGLTHDARRYYKLQHGLMKSEFQQALSFLILTWSFAMFTCLSKKRMSGFWGIFQNVEDLCLCVVEADEFSNIDDFVWKSTWGDRCFVLFQSSSFEKCRARGKPSTWSSCKNSKSKSNDGRSGFLAWDLLCRLPVW